jgi:hypothetical protein
MEELEEPEEGAAVAAPPDCIPLDELPIDGPLLIDVG